MIGNSQTAKPKSPIGRISKAGDNVNHAVSLIDIYPTLKDLCNLEGKVTTESKLQLDGFSIKPFLDNPKTKKWDGPNGALTVLGAGINQPINQQQLRVFLGATAPFLIFKTKRLAELQDQL